MEPRVVIRWILKIYWALLGLIPNKGKKEVAIRSITPTHLSIVNFYLSKELTFIKEDNKCLGRSSFG